MAGSMRGSTTTQNVNVNAQGDPIEITLGSTMSADAFGRLRTSEPFKVFEAKRISSSQMAFHWNDEETAGANTTSTTNTVSRASTIIAVAADEIAARVVQTKRRMNYQPGKSQLLKQTFVLGAAADGIVRRVGLFDESNGVFFQQSFAGGSEVLSLVIRSNVSGTPTDTAVTQANWNVDKFGGAGPSGITLDTSKSQILVADLEWLGVGAVRMGFNIDGINYAAHKFNNANKNAGVYMSTPNLPVRYEISNDGTGAASGLECICCSVESEGGVEPSGITRSANTGAVSINANSVSTYYAIVGIKLIDPQADVAITKLSAVALTGDDFLYEIRLNPDVGGTFTYANLAQSTVAAAVGDVISNPSNTVVTNGIVLASGYVAASGDISFSLDNSYKLGTTINGTSDALVLCVSPLSGGLDIAGGITWRETI